MLATVAELRLHLRSFAAAFQPAVPAFSVMMEPCRTAQDAPDFVWNFVPAPAQSCAVRELDLNMPTPSAVAPVTWSAAM